MGCGWGWGIEIVVGGCVGGMGCLLMCIVVGSVRVWWSVGLWVCGGWWLVGVGVIGCLVGSVVVSGGQWWSVVVSGGQWWSVVVSGGQWGSVGYMGGQCG